MEAGKRKLYSYGQLSLDVNNMRALLQEKGLTYE